MSGLGPPSLSLLVVAPLLLPPLLPAPLSKSVWTLRIVTALTFTLEDLARDMVEAELARTATNSP